MCLQTAARIVADVYDSRWKFDAFLAPVLPDDALLFSLDVADDEIHLDAAIEEEPMPDSVAALSLGESWSTVRDGITEEERLAMLERMTAEGGPSSAGGLLVDRSIARRAATDHVRAVDESYFESYSRFGIHRDMLGDAPRTSTYSAALERNPSLMRGAAVLDVGCGTGILSLFAARAGASVVVGVDGSQRMAALATALAADNGFGPQTGGGAGTVQVVAGKLEEMETLPVKQFDVLVSEWMGYALLFESMLDTVIVARDRFLKPGGAVLPDIAAFFSAGVTREASGTEFWDSVYGFDFSRVAREEHAEALGARLARVLPVPSSAVATQTAAVKSFDLTTVNPEDVEFTAAFELLPRLAERSTVVGVVLWFDTEFSSRFCKEHPVTLTTSPHAAPTHWAQTLFDLKTPLILSGTHVHNAAAVPGAAPGTDALPAASLWCRISVARSARHRSLDVSLEVEARGLDGKQQPAQVMLYEV